MKAPNTFPSTSHRFAGRLVAAVLLALLAACGGGTTGGLVQNANTINSGQDVSGQGTLGCASRPGTPDICARPPENNQGAGGGEGSGSSITSANAPGLAGDAVTLLGLLYDFGGLDGLGSRVLLGASSEPIASFSLGRFMLERLQLLSSLEDQSLLHPTLIMGVYTEPLISCSNGNDKVNIDHTDTALIVTFDNQDGCRYEGVTLQGGVTISDIKRDNGVPADPGSDWSLGATFSFSDFSITQDSVRWDLAGILAFSAQAQNGIVSGTIEATNPLNVSIAGQSLSLRNFRIDYTSASGSTELKVNGSLLRGSAGNNRLSLFTQEGKALVINPVSGMPPDIAGQLQGPFADGTLVLQAVDGSTAVLSVLSAVDVSISVNGVEVQNLSWAELLAASSLP